MEGMNSLELDTAVLFCFFSREATALSVFEQIRLARPKRLYLHSDGPRNDAESAVIESLRTKIRGGIDWDCSVSCLFRERNVGCNEAITSAISWMLSTEECGIILEDDCVPSQSFFRFCAENLVRYKDDDDVAHIAGYLPKSAEAYFEAGNYNESYSFTGVMMCWGWATWRRAFRYEKPCFKMSIYGKLAKSFATVKTRLYYLRAFSKVPETTWDWNWSYLLFSRDKLCIVPHRNLIANIGEESSRVFDSNSGAWNANTTTKEITFPLTHVEGKSIDPVIGELLIDSNAWYREAHKRIGAKINKWFSRG